MTLHDSGQILDLLNEIEHRWPVGEWTCRGLRIWPLVRIQLYFQLVQRLLAEERPASRFGRVSRLAADLGKPLRAGVGASRARWRDRPHNARLAEQADVVCLANTVDRTSIDGVWHDKIFDPFISEFAGRGRRSLVLERTGIRHYRVPRLRPSVLIQPRLDVLTVRTGLWRSRGTAALDGFDACANLVARANARAVMPSEAQIDGWAARLQVFAAFFARVLASSRARLAMTSNYFDLAGMAFILAARRRGLHAVEVQHGVQGDDHAAYGRWTHVPPGGYELLPSVFWCWTPEDADSISRWNGATGAHRALAGGNLWEAAWRRGDHPAQHSYNARLHATKARFDGELDVLVTLQEPLYEPSALGHLWRAIAETQHRWRWWLRQHPTMAVRRRPERLLNAVGVSRAIVDEATEFPLQALLPQMNVHVTHSSAAALEAERFGVASVILSDYGAQLFRRQIASGSWSHARTAEEIVAAVDVHARRQAKQPPAARNGEGGARHALDRLLALGDETGVSPLP